MLCKHYETTKGCVYKDKCQFAHGAHELRSPINVIIFYLDCYANDASSYSNSRSFEKSSKSY